MNRIIIIGNGFDLAHNLPTTYSNFMNDIRNGIFKLTESGPEIKGEQNPSNNTFYYRIDENGEKDEWIVAEHLPRTDEVFLNTIGAKNSIYFNSLFKLYLDTGNWADLENHYFDLLFKNQNSSESINKINREFEHLKNLLKNYLIREIEDKIPNNSRLTGRLKLLMEGRKNEETFEKTFFVSFNYTSKLLWQYYVNYARRNQESFPVAPIHIHGDLETKENPIVFGYGDDNSSEYQKLANN